MQGTTVVDARGCGARCQRSGTAGIGGVRANEARGVLRNRIDMAPISVRPAMHDGRNLRLDPTRCGTSIPVRHVPVHLSFNVCGVGGGDREGVYIRRFRQIIVG